MVDTVTIPVRLKKEMYEQIKEVASKNERMVSQEIRLAIKEYLKSQEDKP
jgi:predicted DNA-binding protein